MTRSLATGFGQVPYTNYVPPGLITVRGTQAALSTTGTQTLGFVTTSPLPAAVVGTPYSTPIQMQGGTPPFNFSLSSVIGTNSWAINATTGYVNGTPSSAQTDSFLITVTDSSTPTAQQVSQTFSVTAANALRYYVGANLNSPSYYSTEMPFLNIVKSASNNRTPNAGVSPWFTSPAEVGNTDAFIYLNSDGYPLTMQPTATTSANGGNPYTGIYTYLNKALNTYGGGLAPGQTSYYPAGSYTLGVTGICSITVSGDAATTTLNNTTASPNTISFNVTPSGNGITLTINSIGSTISNLFVVQTSELTAYEGGAIFGPQFLELMQNVDFARVRCMEWSQAWNAHKQITFSGDVPAGSTSATLNSTTFQHGWDLTSGSYPVQFAGGDIRQVTFTANAYTATWSTPTTTDNPFTQTYYGQAWTPHINQWTQRPRETNVSWAGCKGVPIEVQVALAVQLGCDYWFNTFLAAGTNVMADGAGYYDTQAAALIQSLLASSQKVYVEVSNEVWNSGNTQTNGYANAMGKVLFPSQSSAQTAGQEFYGVKTAAVANIWQSVWGTTAFSSQVVVCMGGQFSTGAGPYNLNEAMTAPDWVALGNTAPYKAPITGVHFAPYFGGIPSSADATQILAQPDGGLSMMFSLMYSNVYQGYTASSVPSSGWVGNCIAGMQSIVSTLEGYSWYAQITNLEFYEIGSSFDVNSSSLSGTQASSFTNLVVEMSRDVRMGYVLYDPTHQLSSNSGYLPALNAITPRTGNYHWDVDVPGQYGEWGLFETVMQPLTSGSMPPKAQAVTNFIAA